MLKDYRILLAACVIAVGAMLLSIAKLVTPGYKAHQKAYAKLTGSTDFEIGVKQINVETKAGLLVDRCTTCHLGAANADAAAFDQPLRTHSEICPGLAEQPHDLNKIGCSICHEGNGRAIDETDAHGHFKHWLSPLLVGREAQASCAKCHYMGAGTLLGAETYLRGKELFVEKVCYACHTIRGLSDGKSAPELTDAGDKFTLAYLKESIVVPTANLATSTMPKFNWTQEADTIAALAIFLKGQRLNKLRDEASAPIGMLAAEQTFASVIEPSVAAGEALFKGAFSGHLQLRGGCINCHAVKNSEGLVQGGENGPELTYVGRARSAAYMASHIRNPKEDALDTIMPPFRHLSDTEIDSLVLYLQSLDYTLPRTPEPTAQALFSNYCMSCHGQNLDGNGSIAALLDPLPRDFTAYQFVASYKDRFVNSIREGVAGGAMAPWQNILTEEEIESLVTYIVSTTEDRQSRFVRMDVSLPKPGDPERHRFRDETRTLEAGDITSGQDAFQKFCASCHGMLANGKGPNAYALKHPLPRDLINKKFLNQSSVTDERLYRSILLGVAGTPMPSHDHLADQTILDIIAYLRSISRDTN
ncbi:MAG: c-type cytochrome [Phycisphaerae bacterium]|nr:c-type cytochrome [Phycisphaerae bacterium]